MKVLTSKRAKYAAIAMAALIVVAALFTGVGKTLAYFTTYAQAKGTVGITLGDKTEITEDMDQKTKVVKISNSSDSQPVFVRVKAFSGSIYDLKYQGDDNWTPGDDGYYYYALPLDPGQSTTELKVTIQFPENADSGDNFDVVVIYETTPVFYDESGNPKADWNNILDITKTTEGGDR